MDVPWQQIQRVPSGNLLHSELENGHRKFVDLPTENGDFP